MPIYEYRCDDCGEVFEAIQRISDEPLGACRHCGGAAERIVSSPAIQFLGSGWYVTDYARKNANGKNGAAKGAPKSDSAKAPDTGSSGKKTGTDSGAKSSASASESRAGSP
jgi:putative FmdB family regulatory protein